MDWRQWVTRTYARLREDAWVVDRYRVGVVGEVLQAALEVVADELAQGGELGLADLGHLSVKVSKARMVKSVFRGEPELFQVPARKRVVFRASSELKRRIGACDGSGMLQADEEGESYVQEEQVRYQVSLES